MKGILVGAAILLSACGAHEQSAGSTTSAPATTAAETTTTAAPATTPAPATATNPYDAAMQKLASASSYHFVYTAESKSGNGVTKADGVYAQANKALQYTYESSSDASSNGEWIDIGNGKDVWRKQNGVWSDKGFIVPPGLAFNMGTMITVVTLRNSTDPANSAPPAPKGIETVDGQECDHYQVQLPNQSYDLYVSRVSGDPVRAKFTDQEATRTLNVSKINEPAVIAPPV